jgi:hypothetical protein
MARKQQATFKVPLWYYVGSSNFLAQPMEMAGQVCERVYVCVSVVFGMCVAFILIHSYTYTYTGYLRCHLRVYFPLEFRLLQGLHVDLHEELLRGGQ